MKPSQLLDLIELMCTYSDNESVLMDKNATEREKQLAQVIDDIYAYSHAFTEHRCQHPDWQAKARKTYSNFVTNHL